MSAYIVEERHIQYIVDQGLALAQRHHMTLRWYLDGDDRGQELRPDNAQEVGQMLWDENGKSVNKRYTRDEDPPNIVGVN